MRDPRGRLAVSGDRVVRVLNDRLPAGDFLRQPIARELVRDKLLIDFELLDELHISAPRVAWVSQPSEWCSAQLLDAALLTLDIAEYALTGGFELKDASAWNVIFDGSTPVFCDHLSFEPIHRREWHAFGQFARHFVLPLLVAHRRGLPVHAQFRMYRDGITPQLARELCGWGMLFSRAAPLMLAASTRSSHAQELAHGATVGRRRTLHANLLGYCRSSLPSRAGIEARHEATARSRGRGWSGYVREREHYPANALEHKQQQVRAWVERTKPSWVLDLGANTGEFSLLAAQAGARVISVDADHDCIERLYLSARREPAFARSIYPVVAQLDDLCGGRGWNGRESPGLATRLSAQCEIVLMLGLLHHLMIACAIPVAQIAEFAAELTNGTVILETVSERDPMFLALAAQYDRTADADRTCGEAAQLQAFTKFFDVVQRSSLPDSCRTLLLLTKKAT
jgi:hypothetical protein